MDPTSAALLMSENVTLKERCAALEATGDEMLDAGRRMMASIYTADYAASELYNRWYLATQAWEELRR